MSIIAIALATLLPVPTPQQGPAAFSLCILCRPQAIADAVGNVLLFLPFGLALGFRGVRFSRATLLGAALSVTVESLQFAIPGRVPSLQDICTNTLGCSAGFLLSGPATGPSLSRALEICREAWDRCKRPDDRTAERLTLAWMLVVMAVFALTAWLLGPALSDGSYVVASKGLDTGNTPLRIGANGSTNGHFRGVIDEIRIFSRALTSEEIQVDSTMPVGETLAIPEEGLVAAYGFEERGGDEVFDSSGHGNTGRLLGASRTTGRFGQGISFDGVHDEIFLAPRPALELTGAMTLEAWILPQGTAGGWPAVIQKGGDHYYLYAGADGVWTPNGGGSFGAADEDVVAYRSLTPGEWTHLAVTYDGATLELFVDGRRVARRVRRAQGHIDEILIGEVKVQPGPVDSLATRRALEAGERIRLQGISGPATGMAGALFDLRDRYSGDRILSLAARGDEVILEYFTVAESLGLHSPQVRVADALRQVKPGSPLQLDLSGVASRRTLVVNGRSYDGTGLSLGAGWGIAVYAGFFPLVVRDAMNAVWMALWLFPLGFWSRVRSGAVAVPLLAGTILLLPSFGTLVPTPPLEWAAAAVGFVIGICARFAAKGP